MDRTLQNETNPIDHLRGILLHCYQLGIIKKEEDYTGQIILTLNLNQGNVCDSKVNKEWKVK